MVGCADAWSQAGTFDVSTRVVGFLSVMGGGIGLMLCAGVYLISRFLLAIVVVLGPVAISCAMFNSTRPIFERWIGKGVSLIILQVAAIITLQIVISGDQTFMAALNPSSGTPDLPTQLQHLTSMAIWLLLGAFAIYSLPAVAYSIGTGVAASVLPVALAAIAGARMAAELLPSGAGDSGGGADAPFDGELNLSLARAELSGGGMAGLPSPPPPALPFASSPALPL